MLEGISDTGWYVINNISTTQMMTAAIMPIVLFAIAFIFLLGLFSIIGHRSKSQEYRSLITDMYVVGMIKKFAKEDEVEILEELKLFNKTMRATKLREKDLDVAIEESLKEKIAAKNDKAIEKIDSEVVFSGK